MPKLDPSIEPPFGETRRNRNSVRLASFDGAAPQTPGPKLRSDTLRSQAAGGAHPLIETDRAVFYPGGHTPFVSTAYDLARYKTRTGTGTLKDVDAATTHSWSLGVRTTTWALTDRWLPVPSPASPDTGTVYFNGDGDSSPTPCTLGSYDSSASAGSTYIIPAFPSGGYWKVTSSTVAEKDPTYTFGFEGICDDSTAAVTLSDPTTWADLETAAAGVLVSGYGTHDYGENPDAIAYNTGAGQSDGTYAMIKRVGRYRFGTGSTRRRVRWREVTRRNNAAVRYSSSFGGTQLGMEPVLYREELTEPLTHPYFDEFGAWKPADLRWDDAGTKLLNWNPYAPSQALVLYGSDYGYTGDTTNEDYWDAVPFATRAQWKVSNPVADMQVSVVIGYGHDIDDPEIYLTETVLLNVDPVTGLSEELLRAAPDFPDDYVFNIVTAVGVLVDGEPVFNRTLQTFYKQRRLLVTSGHDALDGSSTFMVPVKYRVKTYTTEYAIDHSTTRGADYDSGKFFQTPAVGGGTLVTRHSFSATTGLPEWTSGDDVVQSIGEIVERSGSVSGVQWWPTGHWGLFGPLDIDTATVQERSATVSTGFQEIEPLDLLEVLPFPETMGGEVLGVVEKSEIIEAGVTGVWHDVDLATRGAAVFIEDAILLRA